MHKIKEVEENFRDGKSPRKHLVQYLNFLDKPLRSFRQHLTAHW